MVRFMLAAIVAEILKNRPFEAGAGHRRQQPEFPRQCGPPWAESTSRSAPDVTSPSASSRVMRPYPYTPKARAHRPRDP